MTINIELPTMLRLAEVCRRVGLSRSTIYRLIACGEFPRQVNLTKATAAWSATLIAEWVQRGGAKHWLKAA